MFCDSSAFLSWSYQRLHMLFNASSSSKLKLKYVSEWSNLFPLPFDLIMPRTIRCSSEMVTRSLKSFEFIIALRESKNVAELLLAVFIFSTVGRCCIIFQIWMLNVCSARYPLHTPHFKRIDFDDIGDAMVEERKPAWKQWQESIKDSYYKVGFSLNISYVLKISGKRLKEFSFHLLTFGNFSLLHYRGIHLKS